MDNEVCSSGSSGNRAEGTVGALEELLFKMFPKEHCEPWDKCGLLVGDSADEVTGVAIALDPQAQTIERAASLGCNVLLTHHPAYLEAPDRIVDRAHGAGEPAARIRAAISNRVSLIAMHTNLDRSPIAKELLLDKIGLTYAGGLTYERSGEDGTQNAMPSFGCIGVSPDGNHLTLAQLAERCASAYGICPRVWGDSRKELYIIGIANGSGTSFAEGVSSSKVDCLVTGEMSYHNASELVASGKCLVELGHDVSEFPLLEALEKVVKGHALFGGNVHMLGPDVRWWQPGMEKR